MSPGERFLVGFFIWYGRFGVAWCVLGMLVSAYQLSVSRVLLFLRVRGVQRLHVDDHGPRPAGVGEGGVMLWLRIVLLGFTAVAILLEEFGLGLALIAAAYIVLSWEYERCTRDLAISRSFVDYMTREADDG